MDEPVFLSPSSSATIRTTLYHVPPFFKRYLLEQREVREQFEQQAIDQAQFGETGARLDRAAAVGAERNMREPLTVQYCYYDALLHPTSHVRVVESEHTDGLGACPREPTMLVVVRAALPLWGVLFEVSDNNFQALLPSGRGHILAGSLALANHRCGWPLCSR